MKNKTLLQISIPFAITILCYLYSIFSFDLISENINLLKTGFTLVWREVLNLSFYQQLPIFLVIAVWSIIGVVAYCFYYSLNLTYCEIYNYLTEKFYYIHGKELEFKINLKTRLLTHLSVISIYVIIYVLLVVLFLPVGEFLRQYIFITLHSMFTENNSKFLSFVVLYFFWFLVNQFLLIILSKIKLNLFEFSLEKEHSQI